MHDHIAFCTVVLRQPRSTLELLVCLFACISISHFYIKPNRFVAGPFTKFSFDLGSGIAFVTIWFHLRLGGLDALLIQTGLLMGFMLMGITWFTTTKLAWNKVLPATVAFFAFTLWTLRHVSGVWEYTWLIFISGMCVSVIFALARKAYGWLKAPPEEASARKLPGFVVPALFGFTQPMKSRLYVLLTRFKIMDVILTTSALCFLLATVRLIDSTERLSDDFPVMAFYSGLITCLLAWLILQVGQRVPATSSSFLAYATPTFVLAGALQFAVLPQLQADSDLLIPYFIATFVYWLGVRFLYANGYRWASADNIRSEEHAPTINKPRV